MTCWILALFDWRSHDPVGGPPGAGGAAVATGAIARDAATRIAVARVTSIRWGLGEIERVGTITSLLLRTTHLARAVETMVAGAFEPSVEPTGTTLGR